MSVKSWKLPKENRELARLLAEECGVSELTARILVNRGITTYAAADQFLNQDTALEDPFAILDMDRAAERILQAVDSGEPITIYGDYDCDGVTATVILYQYLSMLGAEVDYYIPKRESEGYGLNCDAVRRIHERGTSLIVTVDNGISALEEVRLANSLGMTVVVTDHHQVGEELPEAYAVVNPHRKDCPSCFKELAGVGVAFKLAAALENGSYDGVLEQFADLLAIGTVADLVPLVGENRALVRIGLEVLAHTDNIGLSALMEEAGIAREKLSSQTLAFGIAPRINAAGRMADATLAVGLFLCDDPERAAQLAARLNALNQERRAQEEGIIEDIEAMIAGQPELLCRRVLAFYREGWHPGIIGIAASKVLERYGKPTLLMAADGGVLRGSARSVPFYSLYQLLTACEQYLTQYGGHTQAAGFTLEEADFPAFYEAVEAYSARHYQVMPAFTYEADALLSAQELSLEQIREISVLEPFGTGCQQPLFCLPGAKLRAVIPVSEDRHLRLKLWFDGMEITAMYFGMSTGRFLFREGDTLDLLCTVSINPYQGREYLSVSVRDLRPAGFAQQKFFNARAYYEMFRRKEPLSVSVVRKMIPSRDDTAMVYTWLRQQKGYTGDVDLLFSVFEKKGLNYCRYRVILDMLQELELIRLSPLMDQIELLACSHKVDLESAPTLRSLRERAGRTG